MKKQVSICTNPKECPYEYGDSPNVSDDESFHSNEPSPQNPIKSAPSEILGEATNKRIRKISPKPKQAQNEAEIVKDEEKGMRKWKYPKSPSFVVDMSNDPYQKTEKPKSRGVKKTKPEPGTSRGDQDPPRPNSVYYPPNSPLNHLPKKLAKKNNGGKYMRAFVIGTVILFVAVILYAIVTDVLMSIRDDVNRIKTLMEKIQNSTCNSTF